MAMPVTDDNSRKRSHGEGSGLECCEGAAKPWQATQCGNIRGARPDWHIAVFAPKGCGEMRVDNEGFDGEKLFRSLHETFKSTFAEIVESRTKRSKTAHLECNARHKPPGPNLAEMKDWAANLFPAENVVTFRPIANWDAVDVVHWPFAEKYEASMQAMDTEMVQATGLVPGDTNGRYFKILESPTAPDGLPFDNSSVVGMTKDQLIDFLRKRVAYVNYTNPSEYLVKAWSDELGAYTLKRMGENGVRGMLQRYSVDCQDSKGNDVTYTGVNFMTHDILQYEGTVFKLKTVPSYCN